MCSAGSESSHSNSPKPLADVVLEKLCKKGSTVTRASQFLNELNGRFSGSLPEGITALCAFIASEQLENKDVPVGHARTSSGLSWDQFWQTLSEVQNLLVRAADDSPQFDYLRLPAYIPPCDTCDGKKFECIRRNAPSTKCQVCSIRKKVCTRQDNAHERNHRSQDVSHAHEDDDWLSDLDDDPERSKDLIKVTKTSRSPSPSAQLESLLNDIDESKRAQIPKKPLGLAALSPKWTTLDDPVTRPPTDFSSHPIPATDMRRKPSTKRKFGPTDDTREKKRRSESSSHKSNSKGSDRSTPHIPRPPGIQTTPNTGSTSNGITGFHALGPPPPRKYPRPPTPTSSDTEQNGHYRRSSPPKASSSSTSQQHTDDRQLLRDALQKKAREITAHVETAGCEGIGLRLHILDMKTRLVELDKINAESAPSMSNAAAMEDMLRRAAQAVVTSLRADGCANVELRLMVLDLDTRLAEMDRAR